MINIFFYHQAIGQLTGCPDPQATNFVSTQVINDGSCIYPTTSILPTQSTTLDAVLLETSGLIIHDNQWISHNDGMDQHLFFLDSTYSIQQSIQLLNTTHQDLEEMTNDDQYLYLGDFGNNASGNRQNLSIQRIELDSITDSTSVDFIYFSYSNQTNFSNAGPNNTNFDCEAFIIVDDSIYLFTKQWVDLKTRVYRLPKTPGTYVAECIDSFDVNGLITGVCIDDSTGSITLCGYSPTLQPFVFLLNDYHMHNFFSGNKRRIDIQLPFHQVEAIASTDGKTFWLTNEFFKYSIIEIPQQIHQLDLSMFNPLLYTSNNIVQADKTNKSVGRLRIYPSPASHQITLFAYNTQSIGDIHIFNRTGQHIQSIHSPNNTIEWNIQSLDDGLYFIYQESTCTTTPFVKKSN